MFSWWAIIHQYLVTYTWANPMGAVSSSTAAILYNSAVTSRSEARRNRRVGDSFDLILWCWDVTRTHHNLHEWGKTGPLQLTDVIRFPRVFRWRHQLAVNRSHVMGCLLLRIFSLIAFPSYAGRTLVLTWHRSGDHLNNEGLSQRHLRKCFSSSVVLFLIYGSTSHSDMDQTSFGLAKSFLGLVNIASTLNVPTIFSCFFLFPHFHIGVRPDWNISQRRL